MSEEGWRTPVDAVDYLRGEQKRVSLDQRRPVIRRASDLVGPGISGEAVRVTNYNDLLATFNGYYSSAPGALNAPNEFEAFIGQTVSDADLGGFQALTSLSTGTQYRRSFTRSPTDPESIGWGVWSGQRIPATASGYAIKQTPILANETKILAPPTLTTIGDPSTYKRLDFGVLLLRQGVYTGHVQVGATSLSLVANLYFNLPDADALLSITHFNTPVGPTAYLPFTFSATNASGGMTVSAKHVDPSTTLKMWYRLSITRIGDAV